MLETVGFDIALVVSIALLVFTLVSLSGLRNVIEEAAS